MFLGNYIAKKIDAKWNASLRVGVKECVAMAKAAELLLGDQYRESFLCNFVH